MGRNKVKPEQASKVPNADADPPAIWGSAFLKSLVEAGQKRLPSLAQMRSTDRIELRLKLEAKRKTSTRDEYFAF